MKSSIFDKDPIGSDRRRGILKSSNLLTNRQRPTPKNKSAQLQSTLQFVQAPSSITPTSASTSTSASSSSFQRQAQSSSPYPHSSKSFFSPKPSPSLTPTTNSNISNVNTNDNANVAASSLSISNLNSIPKFKKKSALPPTPPTQSHASGSVVAVSWSLDDMINSYNDSGHLPPPYLQLFLSLAAQAPPLAMMKLMMPMETKVKLVKLVKRTMTSHCQCYHPHYPQYLLRI